MENCKACKQPLKANGEPHKVSDCAEMLHRALDRANLQIEVLTKDNARVGEEERVQREGRVAAEDQLRELRERYQNVDIIGKLEGANRLNGELNGRVEMLTASLESILKREYGLDFQTYLKSKEAGPLTRVLLDELIEKLPGKTEKRNHDVPPMQDCVSPEGQVPNL